MPDPGSPDQEPKPGKPEPGKGAMGWYKPPTEPPRPLNEPDPHYKTARGFLEESSAKTKQEEGVTEGIKSIFAKENELSKVLDRVLPAPEGYADGKVKIDGHTSRYYIDSYGGGRSTAIYGIDMPKLYETLPEFEQYEGSSIAFREGSNERIEDVDPMAIDIPKKYGISTDRTIEIFGKFSPDDPEFVGSKRIIHTCHYYVDANGKGLVVANDGRRREITIGDLESLSMVINNMTRVLTAPTIELKSGSYPNSPKAPSGKPAE